MSVAEAALPDTAAAEELAVTAALLRQSTVHVRSGPHGAGSGVIWRPDGLILTNAHVASSKRATVELSDGRSFSGEVEARDPGRDLAAVRVDARSLPAAVIGDSDALRVGQLVAAVGNPLGMSGAVALGIIHTITPARGRGDHAWVQADIRLLPGNSGGPLADVYGRVIGINSMVAGGLGLAVPSNAVEAFLGGRPRLGAMLQPVSVPRGGATLAGLLVLEVLPYGAADRAGLMVGDIIVGFSGTMFSSASDLGGLLAGLRTGESVRLELLRGGTRLGREVALDREGAVSGAAA